MIGMLVGTLEYKDLSTAVILAGGIGFEVQMPASELATMPPAGSEVRVYTHMSVNENTGIVRGEWTDEKFTLFLRNGEVFALRAGVRMIPKEKEEA